MSQNNFEIKTNLPRGKGEVESLQTGNLSESASMKVWRNVNGQLEAQLSKEINRGDKESSLTYALFSEKGEEYVFSISGSQRLIKSLYNRFSEESLNSEQRLNALLLSIEKYSKSAKISFPQKGIVNIPVGEIINTQHKVPEQTPLADQIDSRTNCYTLQALLSEKKIQEFLKKLGENPIMLYFDFKHMSIANKMILGKNVDDFISQFPKMVREKLGNENIEIIRTGGDEFLILLKNKGSDTRKDILEVKKIVEELRKKYFGRIENPQNIQEEVFNIKLAGSNHVARKRDEKRASNGKNKDDGISEPIMGISTACVQLSGKSVSNVFRYLAFCDRLATKNKTQKFIVDQKVAIKKLPLMFKIRRSDRLLIQQRNKSQKVIKEYENKILNEQNPIYKFYLLKALNYLQAHDASLNGRVLRAGPASEKRFSEILPILMDTEIKGVRNSFDISLFQLVNKKFTSSRADEIFRRLEELVEDEVKTQFKIRVNGGELEVFTRFEIDPDLKEKIQRRFQNYFHYVPLFGIGVTSQRKQNALVNKFSNERKSVNSELVQKLEEVRVFCLSKMRSVMTENDRIFLNDEIKKISQRILEIQKVKETGEVFGSVDNKKSEKMTLIGDQLVKVIL